MQKPNVLVIDDRVYDRVLYKEYLSEENYVINELDDGSELAPFLESHINPQVILLDWQMPKMNGLETLKFLKTSEEYNNIPVIIITGLEDEHVLQEAFEIGCIDFLKKPVSSIELNARVKNVINLFEANALLIEQKNELKELNTIIQTQKAELKESLGIVTELSKLKEESHLMEIKERKRKMMTYEVGNSKMKNTLQGISNDIKSFDLQSDDLAAGLKAITRKIDNLVKEQENKAEFMDLFESIDPSFFKKLISINSKLTPLDLKHCAYMRMNIDNYDLSSILNVEMKSLQMSRYRLKKKLGLSEEQTLREFIMAL